MAGATTGAGSVERVSTFCVCVVRACVRPHAYVGIYNYIQCISKYLSHTEYDVKNQAFGNNSVLDELLFYTRAHDTQLFHQELSNQTFIF